MSSETQSHDAEAHHPHVLPIPLLLGVWGALMVLTGLTVAVSTRDLGSMDLPVAMAIAAVKATLVALIFMHLLWDKAYHSFLVVAALLMTGAFIGGVLFDRVQYQDTIDQLERDHPTPRRYEQKTVSHGDVEHADEGAAQDNNGASDH